MIHTKLPIYKTGVRLLAMGYFIQSNMPRNYKRTLGAKIVDHTSAMLDLMAMANATQGEERVANLQELRKHQRAVEALLRVGHQMRIGHGQIVVATKHWSAAVELLEELGAQCTGWIKSAAGRPLHATYGSHA